MKLPSWHMPPAKARTKVPNRNLLQTSWSLAGTPQSIRRSTAVWWLLWAAGHSTVCWPTTEDASVKCIIQKVQSTLGSNVLVTLFDTKKHMAICRLVALLSWRRVRYSLAMSTSSVVPGNGFTSCRVDPRAPSLPLHEGLGTLSDPVSGCYWPHSLLAVTQNAPYHDILLSLGTNILWQVSLL